jgi:cell division septal protein FtsQ
LKVNEESKDRSLSRDRPDDCIDLIARLPLRVVFTLGCKDDFNYWNFRARTYPKRIDASTPKISIGEPLARVDVQSLRRRILLNQWVSSATIGRNWLHGELTVAVHERAPVASYQAPDGTTHYFEASGLDFLSPIKYPALPNISLNDPSTSAKERVARLLTTLHDKSSVLLENAQSFTVSTAGNGAVALGMKVQISPTRTVTIRWGDGIDIALKIAIYQKLVTLKENAKAQIFDLSDPLSPITK